MLINWVVSRNFYFQRGISLAESFSANFYYVYLTDIYRVFPSEQVLPLLTSEYVSKMGDTLKTVADFLELGEESVLCVV